MKGKIQEPKNYNMNLQEALPRAAGTLKALLRGELSLSENESLCIADQDWDALLLFFKRRASYVSTSNVVDPYSIITSYLYMRDGQEEYRSNPIAQGNTPEEREMYSELLQSELLAINNFLNDKLSKQYGGAYCCIFFKPGNEDGVPRIGSYISNGRREDITQALAEVNKHMSFGNDAYEIEDAKDSAEIDGEKGS